VLAITSDWSRHLLAGLKDGAFDVGVLLLPTGWTPPESVEARRLVTDELVVIAPRTARLPRRVDPSRLADARWILNPEGCGFRVALRQALATAGHPLNVAIELHGPALQIELVAAGFGFGLVPLRALRVHPRRHLVRAGSISHPQMTIGIWFVVGPVSPSLKPAVDLLEQGVRHALEPRKASPVRAAAPAGVGPGGGAAGSRA
jgi:DNA-binding transcriptional LysR family regulator